MVFPSPSGALSNSPAPWPSPPTSPEAARRTVLVIDDEEGPRQAVRMVLRTEYHVLTAGSGPEALALIEQQKVDAAVLDLRMMGMSGIEVLAELKRRAPRIEVVILTAYETLETARQALRLGACDYLTKPFDVVAIRAAVAKAVGRRAAADEMIESVRRLADLQKELQDQRLREEVARSRGEIYGSVLHDINGPLTIISGFTEIMQRQLQGAKALDPEGLAMLHESVHQIGSQVTSCVRISRRYLGFLRQVHAGPARVQVNEILRDLRDLLRLHPSVGRNALEVLALPQEVEVCVHGTDLIQILLNLAINGLQATAEPHRVEVSGRVVAEPLPVAQWSDGPMQRVLVHPEFLNRAPLLGLFVQDQGPGIPAEVIPRLFQTHFTTKGTSGGTGLGLSIVKRLLFNNRAALTLQSELGVGTTFAIYLPIETPAAA